MVEPTYIVDIDLDNDELFESEIALADVRAREGIDIRSGLDRTQLLAKPRAGPMSLALDNRDGSFNPTSNLKRGRAVKVQAVDPADSTTYDLGYGLVSTRKQLPRDIHRMVRVRTHGTLNRLAGKKIGSELYEDITTDVALNHLLDAAEWPKNLPGYVTTVQDNLAAYWRMGEASGNALDSSANSNSGTVTIGSGARDAAALDDAGDGAIEFDGANTKIQVADHSSIQNIFDGGGSIFFMFNIDSDGEGNAGRVCEKVWDIRAQDESSSLVRLQFTVPWSGTNGVWQTAVNIPINTTVMGVLTYDAGAVGNNPTIHLWNGSSFSTLTVGAGLTESTGPPSGARTTDVGSVFVMGNNTGQSATLDGHLDEIALYTDIVTAAEAKSLIARALNAPRHIDVGLTTFTWYWADGDAFQEMVAILDSEGPGAWIYEDGSGAIVFRNRHSIVTDTRSTTVQATFRGVTTTPRYSDFDFDYGLANVVNEATIKIKARAAESLADVWTRGGSAISFGPNEVLTFTAIDTGGDPLTAAVVPVATTDFTIVSGTIASVTLDRTSGPFVTITMTAGGGGASVASLKMRGRVVAVTNEQDVHSSTAQPTSINDHGLKTYKHKIKPEISEDTARGIADAVVGWWVDGRPTITITVPGNRDATALTQVLSRRVGDRIRVIEPNSSIDEEVFIQQLRHHITKGGTLHQTTYGGEVAIDVVYGAWNSGVWNSALWGF